MPIIKTKLKILRTPFSRNSIIKTRYEISEAFYGCVLLVSFFAQNYDQVCSLKKTIFIKKNASKLKSINMLDVAKDGRQSLKKKRKTKNEKNRKIQTTAVKSLYFYFFFFYKKYCVLLGDEVWKNQIYITAFVALQFLCVTEYLERSNDTPITIQICIGLVNNFL